MDFLSDCVKNNNNNKKYYGKHGNLIAEQLIRNLDTKILKRHRLAFLNVLQLKRNFGNSNSSLLYETSFF